jgi:glycerol-3-phosphate dehydrogenase
MDLTEVNLPSFLNQASYMKQSDIQNPQENGEILGKFSLPIQINIEESGQTIMQEIEIVIFRVSVSENQNVSYFLFCFFTGENKHFYKTKTLKYSFKI